MEEETFTFRCPICFDLAKRKEVREYQIEALFPTCIASYMPDILLSSSRSRYWRGQNGIHYKWKVTTHRMEVESLFTLTGSLRISDQDPNLSIYSA